MCILSHFKVENLREKLGTFKKKVKKIMETKVEKKTILSSSVSKIQKYLFLNDDVIKQSISEQQLILSRKKLMSC